MKKTLLMIMLLVAGVLSSHAYSWVEMAPEIANELNVASSQMEESFKKMGIPATTSCIYNKSNRSVDLTIDFGSMDIVPYLGESMMDQIRQEFLDGFDKNMINDKGPDGLMELANAMIYDSGSIRIIFKGAGKEQSVSITGADLLTIR